MHNNLNDCNVTSECRYCASERKAIEREAVRNEWLTKGGYYSNDDITMQNGLHIHYGTAVTLTPTGNADGGFILALRDVEDSPKSEVSLAWVIRQKFVEIRPDRVKTPATAY